MNTAGAAAGASTTTTMSSLHGHSRQAFIMTSAQSHRMSAAQSSSVGRAYENTYKTEPEKSFSAAAAKWVIRDIMEAMLEGAQYETEACKGLAVTLADAIKKRVKELGHPRYKIITVVAIGQANDTSVAYASRCMWNVNFDSFAEYTYKNSSLFAVGLVYALYCD